MQAKGTLGLIATNTVAQGDSREVGLDAMVADGFTITRAIQSRSWPAASANLEYAAVWGSRGPVAENVPKIADETPVQRISTLLEAAGRFEAHPQRLAENSGIAYIGCYVLGMGFVLEESEAQEWIAADPRNAEVLFPYLNGEDLNSRPDASASRWVIDFNDRSEAEAASYPLPYARVLERVKPERSKNKRKVRRDTWWRFAERASGLRTAVAPLPQVLVIARVSKTLMPVRVPTGQVPSEACVVFATDSYAQQALLSSSLHQLWAIAYGSGLRSDPRYTPSDVFETFPRPENTRGISPLGFKLDTTRREVMKRREIGLTMLYNLMNDPSVSSYANPDVARLRALHAELDACCLDIYGWTDVETEHGFHSYKGMRRWMPSAAARTEILDRLLEINLSRAD